MKTRQKMRQLAEEQLERITQNNLTETLYYEAGQMQEIIDETTTDSSTEYIHDLWFEFGEFSAIKSTISRTLRKAIA